MTEEAFYHSEGGKSTGNSKIAKKILHLHVFCVPLKGFLLELGT